MDRLNITHQAKRKGFSLIEAAIVLGVVGIVIGAIWVAASAVMENIKVNKTVEGIFTISRNVQSLVSDADAISIGDSKKYPYELLTKFSPKDWVRTSTIESPYGRVTVTNNFWRFAINIDDVPASACGKIAASVSAISAKNGGTGLSSVTHATGSNFGSLLRISLNYPSHIFSSFPILPNLAYERCVQYADANKNLDMAFTFAYSRTR